MFHVDSAIQSWRQQMRSAGIWSSDALDELESHLREEIERQERLGLAPLKAFETATREIGSPSLLKAEFDKENERNIMKKSLIILLGVLGLLVGMALIMPAAHLYREQGMVHNATIGFAWGIPVVVSGVSTIIFGFKKRKA